MAGTEVPQQCQACYACAVLKLLLMSVLLATFLLPAAAAAGRKPFRALRITLVSMLVAELAYAFFLRFIFGHML
jgi:hypothetical protein